MAFDTFIKIAEVPGESTADGQQGNIEIFSFSWGASSPAQVSPGTTGLSSGRVSVSDFSVMKKTDKASAKLFQACCTGGHFKEMLVMCRKATGDGGQDAFLTYKFTDVMVSSIQWSGSSGGDDTPTESVSFAYAKVEIEYKIQDTKTGKLSTAGQAAWDQTTLKS